MSKLEKESEELSKESLSPTFWSDIAKATEINKKLSDINDKLELVKDISNKLNQVLDQLEFLKLENDPDIFSDCDNLLVDVTREFDKFEKSIFFCEPYDAFDAIVEFHPGAGGTEAHDWASMLLRMYQRYCEIAGFKCQLIDILEGEEAGISSATLLISGKMAYGNLRSEAGVHRLVRNSPFDADGARHTSFASVSVTPQFDNTIKIDINPADLRIDTYHSSGAGGQNVNKTESAVRITHKPTGIVVSCQVERDQLANKETCMAMLKSKLFQLEEKKRQEELSSITGNKLNISFSSQIRSYVFCPYTLVSDRRTGFEDTDVYSVMDGNIQPFIDEYLRWSFKQTHKES